MRHSAVAGGAGQTAAGFGEFLVDELHADAHVFGKLREGESCLLPCAFFVIDSCLADLGEIANDLRRVAGLAQEACGLLRAGEPQAGKKALAPGRQGPDPLVQRLVLAGKVRLETQLEIRQRARHVRGERGKLFLQSFDDRRIGSRMTQGAHNPIARGIAAADAGRTAHAAMQLGKGYRRARNGEYLIESFVDLAVAHTRTRAPNIRPAGNAITERDSVDHHRWRFYIPRMGNDHTNERFDVELKRLERRLDELVVICRQLQEENRSLKQRQDALMAERASLLQKNEQVRGRVEAMVTRLKAMEQTP